METPGEVQTGVQTLDMGPRDLDQTVSQAIQRQGQLTLSGQINVGGEMNITHNHVHDQRVTHKHVHNGDVHQVTSHVLHQRNVVNHLHYHDASSSTAAAPSCATACIEGQSRLEMDSTVDVYVVTQSHRQALQLLSSHGVLVLTGPPACGKSSLAHALMHSYAEQNYSPLIVKSYEEWRLHAGRDGHRKQIILLDHVLGREEIDDRCFQKWNESFRTLQAFTEDGMSLVIVAVNDHVLAEVFNRQSLILNFCGNSDESLFHAVLDMSSMPLTNDEKTEILQKHVERKGKTIPPADVEEILEKDASGCFFPMTCKQYANSLGKGHNPSHLFTGEVQKKQTDRQQKTKSACLFAACRRGDVRQVQDMLDGEVNGATEVQDSNGDTVLHVACRQGFVDVIKCLLTKCLLDIISIQNDEGQSPLDVACESGHSSIVQILLEHGTPVNKAEKGLSPLHVACWKGHVNIVNMLLEHKAAVNHTDHADQTALHYVLGDRTKSQEQNQTDILKLLLNHGASVFHTDQYGISPVDLALTYSQNEFIQKTVLLHIAKKDLRTSTGATALHLACQFCSEDVVRYVVQLSFSDCNLEVRDLEGATPLLTAIKSQNVFRTKVTGFLLDKGCDIYAENYNGICPFDEFIKKGSELLAVFIQHGVDLHRLDWSGNSLLHLAVQHEMDKYGIYQLLACGLSIHAMNTDGDTPLHIACALGNPDAVKILLDIGSSIETRNNDGKSALDIAFENNQTDVISLIRYKQMKYRHAKAVNEEVTVGSLQRSHKDKNDCTEQMNDQDPMVKCNQRQNECSSQGLDVGLETVGHPASTEGRCSSLSCSEKPTASTCWYCQHSVHTVKDDRNINGFSSSKDFQQACEHCLPVETNCTRHLTDLFTACKNNDLTSVQTLLDKKEDVNCRDESGRTPLHFAAARGHVTIADRLLQHGCKVNVMDNHRQCPLHLACGSDHAVLAAMLLSNGADGDAVDENGETALHTAIRNGYTSTVAVLAARTVDMNRGDKQGRTALHLAALHGHTDLCLLLLHAGSDIKARDRQGHTAVGVAALGAHTTLLDVLERHVYFTCRSNKACRADWWQQLYLIPAILLILAWLCSVSI